MKILIYKGDYDLVKQSGVGQAIEHQEKALKLNNIDYTTDETDDYDIVHINTIMPKSKKFGRKAKKQGKKVIYYGHSTMEDFRNSFRGANLLSRLFKRWIISCYNIGDIIITPSQYSKNILEGYGINKKIYSLSNGIDLDKFKGDKDSRKRFRDKYNLKDDDKVIISVGHLMKRKGLDDFIEVARKLPQYKFIWFGHTNPKLLTTHIKKAIKNKPDNVIMAGYVDQKELVDCYRGSDLFLFMTREETEGIVLLEAFASKIKVLVRDIKIYENMFTDGKEVIKAKTNDEFKNKIVNIINGKYSTVEEAYRYVKERSVQKIGEKLKSIYLKLEDA
ncbi:glycosyltransferase [Finegoldia magna]|uniref:glycosyltransferase n=1 Tax=Finegoldia magna TaxID=1260 RepID=UPI0023A99810|nr:glycosyltransferase [Finegoldia magna]MCC2717011.1 glycosyltransferase [Finegoldia magna]MDU3805675.1 glycosyltransferase [Finegoldia magna]